MTEPQTTGAVKSCLTCPSYLKDGEVVSFFKKSPGAPMCARFGHVLGKPGLKPAQEQMIADSFGSACTDHGEPTPPFPTQIRMGVALPDPTVLSDGIPDDNTRSQVASCLGCKNYVAEEAVIEELGWASGMCSAKGRLLMANRLNSEARECEWRTPGAPRVTTAGMELRSVYADAFGLDIDPVAAFLKATHDDIVEPTEYPTDRDVSPEEIEAGIRAWRKVWSPDQENHTFLPIFDTAFFSKEEQALIPQTGSDEHPELYADHAGNVYEIAVAWRELDETPALWGPAGVGKTEVFRHLAWLMNLPFHRVSITASSEVDDLIGKTLYDPEKGTYFHYGRLPKAWRSAGVMVLDESNTGPNEIAQVVRPLIDNSKQLVVDQNEGELIDRHPDCYLGFANNPAWDVRNVGAQTLADADGSRLFHIKMDLPPARVEREIIRARVALDGWEIDNKRLDAIMGIAEELRVMSADGTLPISWGLRPQIKVARASRWFSLPTAYRRAAADYLEPEAEELVLSVVDAYTAKGNSKSSRIDTTHF